MDYLTDRNRRIGRIRDALTMAGMLLAGAGLMYGVIVIYERIGKRFDFSFGCFGKQRP